MPSISIKLAFREIRSVGALVNWELVSLLQVRVERVHENAAKCDEFGVFVVTSLTIMTCWRGGSHSNPVYRLLCGKKLDVSVESPMPRTVISDFLPSGLSRKRAGAVHQELQSIGPKDGVRAA